jgi:hypothetical protein
LPFLVYGRLARGAAASSRGAHEGLCVRSSSPSTHVCAPQRTR